MAQPMVIDLRLTDDDKAEQSIERVATSLDGLGKELDSVKRLFGDVKKEADSFSDLSKMERTARAATGPLERLARAQKELNKAREDGKSTFDAEYKVARAESALKRAQEYMRPKTQSDKVREMYSTSRVIMDAAGNMHFMPLVNKMISAGFTGGVGGFGGFGKGAAASASASASADATAAAVASEAGATAGAAGAGLVIGAIALPVIVAGAALMGLTKAAQEAEANLHSFSINKAISGGTGTETRQLLRLGDLLGVGDIGSFARQFGEGLMHGGMSTVYAASMGINVRGGIFGDMDYAKKLLEYVQGVVGEKNDHKAQQMANAAGMPELMALRVAPDEVLKLIQLQKEAYSPEALKSQMEFTIEMTKLKDVFREFSVVIGSPVLRAGLKAVEVGMLMMANQFGPILRLLGIDGSGTFAHDAESATQENTSATKELTRALRESRETLGGGPRATGALPASWRYQMLVNALDSDRHQLGAM